MQWKSIIFTLGPLVLPKIISYGRAIYATIRYPSTRVRPIPADAQRALNILFISVAIFLVLSLPSLGPENIFQITDARLQTSNEVLFTRLKAKRQGTGLDGLTDADLVLKDRLQTRDGRLLYLQYGPDALAGCPFCFTNSPRSFLLYVLPTILTPHLTHLAILGLATSALIAGSDAASWRSHAAFAGTAIAAVELFMLNNYDPNVNSRALRKDDIEHYFWIARTVRYIALALADLALSGLIYLSATRRAFFKHISPVAERLEATTKLLEAQSAKLGALGALRNTVMRDRGLRNQLEHYWTEEAVVMSEVNEDAEVIEGTKSFAGRFDLQAVDKRAADIADEILSSLSKQPASEPAG